MWPGENRRTRSPPARPAARATGTMAAIQADTRPSMRPRRVLGKPFDGERLRPPPGPASPPLASRRRRLSSWTATESVVVVLADACTRGLAACGNASLAAEGERVRRSAVFLLVVHLRSRRRRRGGRSRPHERGTGRRPTIAGCSRSLGRRATRAARRVLGGCDRRRDALSPLSKSSVGRTGSPSRNRTQVPAPGHRRTRCRRSRLASRGARCDSASAAARSRRASVFCGIPREDVFQKQENEDQQWRQR
jgi:hypothetical protein